MGGNHGKLEAIAPKLWQIEVLHGQGMPFADPGQQGGITRQIYDMRRRQYGGMNWNQPTPLKDLEKEARRLRRAVSDLTLDKLIPAEAARGNLRGSRAAADASPTCGQAFWHVRAPPLPQAGPESICTWKGATWPGGVSAPDN